MGADELDPLGRAPRLLEWSTDLEGKLHRDLRHRETCDGVSLHLGAAHVEERDARHAIEAAATKHEGCGLRVEAEQVRQAPTKDVEGLGEHSGHTALRAEQGDA